MAPDALQRSWGLHSSEGRSHAIPEDIQRRARPFREAALKYDSRRREFLRERIQANPTPPLSSEFREPYEAIRRGMLTGGGAPHFAGMEALDGLARMALEQEYHDLLAGHFATRATTGSPYYYRFLPAVDLNGQPTDLNLRMIGLLPPEGVLPGLPRQREVRADAAGRNPPACRTGVAPHAGFVPGLGAAAHARRRRPRGARPGRQWLRLRLRHFDGTIKVQGRVSAPLFLV